MDVIVIQNYLLATMATLLLFHLFFLEKFAWGKRLFFITLLKKRKDVIVSVGVAAWNVSLRMQAFRKQSVEGDTIANQTCHEHPS